jgi:hypothetical protein
MLIARHDAGLARNLTKSDRFGTERLSDPNSGLNAAGLNTAASPRTLQLQMASNLIATNPVASASLLKAVLSTGIDPVAVGVIKSLRSVNSSLADALFDQALVYAERDQTRLAANLVSLSQYFAGAESGFPLSLDHSTSGQPSAAESTRFLSFAYAAIMRATGSILDDSWSGRALSVDSVVDDDMLSTAVRLLPLFDRYQPSLAQTIKARLETIANTLPEGGASEEIFGAIRNQAAPDPELQAQSMPDSPLRDALYCQAAEHAAKTGDFDAALRIAQFVTSDSVRDTISERVRASAVRDNLKKNDIDAASRMGLYVE